MYNIAGVPISCLLTYLLTYLRIPWSKVLLEKLTVSKLVQKFPAFYGTSKVHYRIYKCPPPVPTSSQLHPVHVPTSHFLKIHLNIILPSTPGPYKSPFSRRFPHRNPVYASPLPHTSYMPRPSHSRFYHPQKLGEKHRSLSSSLCSFLHSSSYLVPSGPKYSPLHPILKHPRRTFLPQCE